MARTLSHCSSCGNYVQSVSNNANPRESFILDVGELDDAPFSESFCPDLLESESLQVGQQVGMLKDTSFNIDSIPVEDLSSEWGDDDIEEILVMRKKASCSLPRLSTIQEEDRDLKNARIPRVAPTPASHECATSRPKASVLHDFDILEGGESDLIHCRRKETGVVYAMRRLAVDRNENCWLEREILESLKTSLNPFAWRLHWSFEDTHFLYMVLDLHPCTLEEHVAEHGPLHPDQTYLFASELIVGLMAIHASGILHQCLTPRSIMLDGAGHVVLANFNHARYISSSKPPSVLTLPHSDSDYRAPETILGWRPQSSVDCWSLGCVLYFMAFAQHCFSRTKANQLSSQSAILSGLISFPARAAQEPLLQDLVQQLVQPNPSLRLNLLAAQEHAYFSKVCWQDIRNKATFESPYLEQDQSMFKGDCLISENREPHDFDDSASAFSKTARQHIQPLLPTIFRTNSGLDTNDNAQANESLSSNSECGNSIRTPTQEQNTMERMNLFWEELDRELATLGHDRPGYSSKSMPHPLRKQRSFLPARLSFLGSSDSLGIISETKKIRKAPSKLIKTHGSSTPDLKKLLHTPSSNATAVDAEPLDLPSGVKQIGSGIGFTYSMPAPSRLSKVSLQSILKPSTPVDSSASLDTRPTPQLRRKESRLSLLARKMARSLKKSKNGTTTGVTIARTSITVEDDGEQYECRASEAPVVNIGGASPSLTGEAGGPTMRLVPTAGKPIGLGTRHSLSDL